MSQRSAIKLTVVEPTAPAVPSFNRFEQFRRDYGLSYRELGRLVGAGKSNTHRACTGETPHPEFLQRRSQIEPVLRSFLAKRLLSPKAISEAINEFFASQEDTVPIPRCELTKAAVRHFNLKGDPFQLDLEHPDEYFISAQLQRVIDQTTRAVQQRRFLALLGGVGSGKTALRHRLMTSFAEDDSVRFVWIETADFEQCTFVELVWTILAELGEKPATMRVARVRQLTQVLSSLSKSGVRVVLCIEEAHRLSDKALATLKMFWEKGEAGDSERYNRYMGVMLFGQPRLEERLRSHQFQEVIERLQIIKMPDFGKQATAYLGHRLGCVGGKIEELFEPSAITHIAKRATTPLALGNLANAALMMAFEMGEPKVQVGMLIAENEPQIRGTRARA